MACFGSTKIRKKKSTEIKFLKPKSQDMEITIPSISYLVRSDKIGITAWKEE